MEATKMSLALKELAEQYTVPKSYVQVARDAVLEKLANKNKIEMPAILDDKQRKAFVDKIEYLAGFLESDDGADAIEFLMNAYEHYCERMAEAETEAIQEQI